MLKRCFWIVIVVTFCLASCKATPDVAQTPSNPAQIIENKGSDTLVNLALAWAEAYMQIHPDVRISVTGGGSGTGIAAMINGTVDIANASREMKEQEKEAARANGIEPVEFVVARDAIAVVVHPSNPVNRLTLQQISDIYTGKITNWRQVGGENRPIVLLSRESNSGTYVYFLENVIRMGNPKSDLLFSPDTLLMPSSEGISTEIRQNPNAIGYDGLGYVTNDQKVIAVAANPDGPFVLPSVETVNDGSYPISRPLYMYTAGEPTGAIRAYLEWILSDGQAIVPQLGFVPIKPNPATDSLRMEYSRIGMRELCEDARAMRGCASYARMRELRTEHWNARAGNVSNRFVQDTGLWKNANQSGLADRE